MSLYAGHGVGAVTEVRPAAEVVHELADGAARLLAAHVGREDAPTPARAWPPVSPSDSPNTTHSGVRTR